MNILIALDSFKGSLSAKLACDIVRRTLERSELPCSCETIPMADGGEGTAAALVAGSKGSFRQLTGIVGPLPKMTLKAEIGWLPQTRTAVIEMAQASGLPLLTPAQRNPLHTTTYGTGQLIAGALRMGAREILLTLGGSATVDGGTGAARALGWRFVDRHGRDVASGGGALFAVHAIIPPPRPFSLALKVLCDVTNPLCGPTGAAEVYGPQKGATPEMVDRLEAALCHLADLIERDLGIWIRQLPGAGAAGGFGGGAAAFLGGKLVPGIDVIAQFTGLEKAMRKADWVITGEGRLDSQSLCGKVVQGVCRAAHATGTRVAVLAGTSLLKGEEWKKVGIAAVEVCTEGEIPLSEAMRNAGALLAAASVRLTGKLQEARGKPSGS